MHSPDPKPPSGWGLAKPQSHLGQPKIIVKTSQKQSQGWGCAAQCHILGWPVQAQQLDSAGPCGSLPARDIPRPTEV